MSVYNDNEEVHKLLDKLKSQWWLNTLVSLFLIVLLFSTSIDKFLMIAAVVSGLSLGLGLVGWLLHEFTKGDKE